jgi:hypothetical protein
LYDLIAKLPESHLKFLIEEFVDDGAAVVDIFFENNVEPK